MRARRVMRGSRELGIAPASASAAGNYESVIGVREVVDPLSGVGVVNDGSDGDSKQNVFAFPPGFIRTFAVASTLSFVFGIEAEMDQRIVSLARFHNDVAALATIATRGASARDELLPSKSEAAVAAVAGFHADCSFIDEHRRWFLIEYIGGRVISQT